MSSVARPNEEFTYRQTVYFEEYLYGTSSGSIPSGQIIIQRGDGFYWDGLAFVATPTTLSTTIVGTYHEYTFVFPPDLDTVYNFTMFVNNDEATESKWSVIVRLGPQETFDAVDFITGFPSTVLTE